MHQLRMPYPVDLVAIWRAAVYFAWAVGAFNAGIKCWHCILKIFTNKVYMYDFNTLVVIIKLTFLFHFKRNLLIF